MEGSKSIEIPRGPHMDMIIPGLYLGNAFAQRNESHLQKHGITHILSVAPGHFASEGIPQRKTIAVDDYPDVELMIHFAETNAYISGALEEGGVLVHCLQGISRSATVAAAYLMATHALSHQEAITFLKSRRPTVGPNFGFIRQLEMYGIAQCDMDSEEGKRMSNLWQKEMETIYLAAIKEVN